MNHKDTSTFFAMGETIENLIIDNKPINYPVLNERAVRAGAGIMLVIGAFAFINSFLLNEQMYLKAVVVLFFLDFGVRILVNPRFSPILIIGKFIVKNQKAEFVGAIQKKFAWSLGFIMTFAMIVMLFTLNIQGGITTVICIICLTLMFFETSFGICLGCNMYYGLKNIGIIKSKEDPLCPGGSCSID